MGIGHRASWLALALALVLPLVGCPEEAGPPESLILAVSSDQLVGTGNLDALQFTATDGTTLFPAAGNLAAGTFELAETDNPVARPVYLGIEYGGTFFSGATVEATVVGLRGGAAAAIWSGTITLTDKVVVTVRLRALGPDCDGDSDGFVDCQIPGCCEGGVLPPSDCEPTEASGNPWGVEPQCEPCDDVIDQDCSGEDRPCADADGDGIADCIEVEADCGVGNPAVGPGFTELCDGLDNDCNGQTDEGLQTLLDEPLGAPCGFPDSDCGTGVIVCDADPAAPPLCSALAFANEEVCGDGRDNDCDGVVDEQCSAADVDGDGFDADVDCNDFDTGFNPGPNVFEPCCAQALAAGEDPLAPSQAVLDQCDNNCDGTVTFCLPADLDGDGVESPADCDDTDPTVYPGAPEKCDDGIDQDCFGGDVPCSLVSDQDGDGYDDVSDCDDDSALTYPGAPELCDGEDNDCDGIVDEGNPEAGVVCGTDEGVCQAGFSVCQNSTDGVAVNCIGEIEGGEELCDGLDNDCNGVTDDDLTYEGSFVGGNCDGVGECGFGVVECTAGKAPTCSTNPDGSAYIPTAEICDGLDNDCDGETDEDLTIGDADCLKQGVCADALDQILASCDLGVWVCSYDNVEGYQGPVELTCDGLDNDCDGFVDDDFNVGQGCSPDGGTCATGVIACAPAGSAEQTICDESNTSSEEVCDGLDNDCDGETDEDFANLGQPCDGPDTDSCENGVFVCTPDAQGTQCGAETAQNIPEICDGQDNDCDGETDELFPSLGAPCDGDDADACTNGTFTCIPDGSDVECVNEVGDVAVELCNGEDDDCDGFVDEDADSRLGSPCDGDDSDMCEEGIWECPPDGDNANLVCSDGTGDTVETCNGDDDDCDGVVDNGITGSANDGGCSNEGVCSGQASNITASCDLGGTGTWTCNYTAVPNYLVDESDPAACDGLDNNCNGIVDEGFPNLDGDSAADCVDTDIDGDGVDNEIGGAISNPCTGGETENCQDNCVLEPNSDQADLDGDTVGDACDDDIDGDLVLNDVDNCPLVDNPGQEDADNNGLGDLCEISCEKDTSFCLADGRTLATCNSDGDGYSDEEFCDYMCEDDSCWLPTGSTPQALIAGCDDSAPTLSLTSGKAFVTATELQVCPDGTCAGGTSTIASLQTSTDVTTPIIFCVSSMTVAAGTQLLPSPGSPPPGPVIFLVDGEVSIGGEILFDGAAAAGATGGAGGPGGYAGGDRPDSGGGNPGGAPAGDEADGGQGSGNSNYEAGGGGGGGHEEDGGDGGDGKDGNGGAKGTKYANGGLNPLTGGGGGGTGGAAGAPGAGSGGGGGGAIQIASRETITILNGGFIYARGGTGGSVSGRHGGGGGGAGGGILLEARTVSLPDQCLVVIGGNGGSAGAGAGGAGATTGEKGSNGASSNANGDGGSGGGGAAGIVRLNVPASNAPCASVVPEPACHENDPPQP